MTMSVRQETKKISMPPINYANTALDLVTLHGGGQSLLRNKCIEYTSSLLK